MGIGERWLPIEGYGDQYMVSDRGRVRSWARGWTWRLLKPGLGTDGYPRVTLAGRRKRTLHSLVADAFLEPCPPGHEVRHKDGDRTNPALGNLEYGTHVQNERDKRRHGTALLGEKNPAAKLTTNQVLTIRAMAGNHTQRALAEAFSISLTVINMVIKRRIWTHI